MADAQAFWRVKQLFLFASGSYLANPGDTNGTPSIITVLGLPTTPGTQFEGLDVNSVPDQYVARAGGTVHVWKGINGSLAWRMEGLKRYDLFGDSFGWRRPGTAMFVEPGISYTHGRHAISFNVPIGYYYNRRPNPYTGRAGDATFPRQIFLTSYSVRLGKRLTATDQPPTRPVPRPPSETAPPEPDAAGSRERTPAAAAAGACPL